RQACRISPARLSECAVRTTRVRHIRRTSTILNIASVSSPPCLLLSFQSRGQDDHCKTLSCSNTGINDRGRAFCGTGENRGASGGTRCKAGSGRADKDPRDGSCGQPGGGCG